MNIVDCITGIMYIVVLGCVLYYINKFQMAKLKKDNKPINKVHFYVARDKSGPLYLYLGKPERRDYSFLTSCGPCVNFIANEYHFKDVGLNPDDFNTLKWEDEPVEVFLNMED